MPCGPWWAHWKSEEEEAEEEEAGRGQERCDGGVAHWGEGGRGQGGGEREGGWEVYLASWASLGPCWGHLGRLGRRGCVSRPSWGFLGLSGALQGARDSASPGGPKVCPDQFSMCEFIRCINAAISRFTHIHICVRVYTYTHMLYIYVYKHIYIYIYIYISIYMRM